MRRGLPHPVHGGVLSPGRLGDRARIAEHLPDGVRVQRQHHRLGVVAAHVRKEIGAIAVPDKIQFAPGLPKTRSGKIMRRILRKIAENQTDQIGDTTTLADPAWWTRWSKGSNKSEAAGVAASD